MLRKFNLKFDYILSENVKVFYLVNCPIGGLISSKVKSGVFGVRKNPEMQRHLIKEEVVWIGLILELIASLPYPS